MKDLASVYLSGPSTSEAPKHCLVYQVIRVLYRWAGRPTLLCFAIDVTERNALRREFLEATDLQRRRLADELRYGFGRTLGELELGATRLEQSAGTGKVDSAAIALIARSSQRAVEVCREMAHSAASAPGSTLSAHLSQGVPQRSAGDLHPAGVGLIHLENEEYRTRHRQSPDAEGRNDGYIGARQQTEPEE